MVWQLLVLSSERGLTPPDQPYTQKFISWDDSVSGIINFVEMKMTLP